MGLYFQDLAAREEIEKLEDWKIERLELRI
jgi:hypothetical protein